MLVAVVLGMVVGRAIDKYDETSKTIDIAGSTFIANMERAGFKNVVLTQDDSIPCAANESFAGTFHAQDQADQMVRGSVCFDLAQKSISPISALASF